jgi:hypothetical protein
VQADKEQRLVTADLDGQEQHQALQIQITAAKDAWHFMQQLCSEAADLSVCCHKRFVKFNLHSMFDVLAVDDWRRATN